LIRLIAGKIVNSATLTDTPTRAMFNA